MGATRRRFTEEYKEEAVALVLGSDRPIAEIAKSLGVSGTSLGYWVKKAKDAGEVTEKPLTVSERAELEELRRKNAQLQMDNAFLKKVASFFASDQK